MLTATNIVKSFSMGESRQQVLKGVDFKVETGEFVAVMGRSGAGKSTLLYILSLLDQPDSGQIVVDSQKISDLSKSAAVAYRLNNFGFVFQEYALLPELNAVENVAVPLLMRGSRQKAAYGIAREALAKVGLGDKFDNLPSQLSGGEQQRVSIARALAHQPKIIFADEPTANLDTERSCGIMDIFLSLNHQGQTIVMVTHELEFAESANRIIELKDGLIIGDKRIAKPRSSACRLYRSVIAK